jgi:hypothetical protein
MVGCDGPIRWQILRIPLYLTFNQKFEGAGWMPLAVLLDDGVSRLRHGCAPGLKCVIS